MKYSTRHRPTIILALCAAAMIAMYCVQFEFNNPVDPANTYTLTVNRNLTAGGTVTPASAQSGVIAGVPVDITATPASGYTFVNWTAESGTATFGNRDSANTTVTLNSNATIRADFELITYTLTVNRDPTAGGTVTPASAQSGITAGTSVNISATANSGYRFVDWTVTNGTAEFGNANNAATTVTLSSGATISANFEFFPFNPLITYGSFVDSRDGQTYRTVVIGTQTWMAENLNFNASGSVCHVNNTSNCDRYGRLYDWATVMGFSSTCNFSECASQIQFPHRGICPVGWRVPSDDDWTALVNFVSIDGAGSDAGTILKSRTGWRDWDGNDAGNGTDNFGFSALPGGGRRTDGSFLNVYHDGFWWSATENHANGAWVRNMNWDHSNVIKNPYDKALQFPVRCLRND